MRGARGAMAVGAILAAAAGLAVAADVGGGFWSACGNCRSVVRMAGVRPAKFFMNWRLAFDGAPGDTGGTGTLTVYDEAGEHLQATVPYTWETRRGSSFRADLLCPEFAGVVASTVERMAGGTAEVVLEKASGRGVLLPRGGDLKLQVQVKGTVSVDGGDPVRVKMTMHLR